MLKFTLKYFTVVPKYFGLLWPSSGSFSLNLAKVTLICRSHRYAVLWQHVHMLPQYCINHDDVILPMTSTNKCNFSQVQWKAPWWWS